MRVVPVGEVGPPELAQRELMELTRYHRYRASEHASRSFAGFPLLLIVTLDPGAEQRPR